MLRPDVIGDMELKEKYKKTSSIFDTYEILAES